MSKILIFLYTYYELYLYLSVAGIGTGIAFFLWKKRTANPISVKKMSIVFTGGFLTDFFMSIILIHHLRIQDQWDHPPVYVIALKVFISILCGAILVPVLLQLFHLLGIFMHSKFYKKYSYGLYIFAMTTTHLILNLPQTLNSWCTVWYATNYSMGIGSRFFIGTFLKIFHRGYLEFKTAYHFYAGTLILLIMLTSYLLNELLQHAESGYKKALIFVIICFIAGPGYISAMWSVENMGRLETYTLLIAFLSCVLFTACRNVYVRYGLITVLSCISMAIYQGNLFMYYPIILMLIIWDCLPPGRQALIKRAVGLINVLATVLTFTFFQFFSSTNFKNAEEMTAALRGKTDLPIEQSAINFELFQSVQTAYENVTIDFLNEAAPRERTFLTLLLLFPIIVLVASIYLKCREIRISEGSRTFTMPYIYYALLPFAILPQFLLNTDWGRWMTSTYIVTFFGILYLAHQKDLGILKSLEALEIFIDKHTFVCLLIVLYLAGLSKFLGRVFIPETDSLMSILSTLIR